MESSEAVHRQNSRGKRQRAIDEAGGVLEADEEVKIEASVEDSKGGEEGAEGGDKKMELEVEAKVVHAIAGGRTDAELKTFYREVHRKMTEHYPSTWLLTTPLQDASRQLKKEKKEKQEQEMSQEEEEKELEREEEEMEKVEGQEQKMVKNEDEKEAEAEVSSPRRNPARRKRAKIEIKIENEEEATASNVEQKQKKTNVCGGQKTVLASLISTVLSQNTTDRNSAAAWANLKRAYNEDWERVRTAKPSQLADVIRTGGLAQRKGAIIQGVLNQLLEERGELSLEHLRDMPTEEVKQALTKYKGIGPKTASCVLMFNMKRDDFPVDTHVQRVSTRLGFVRGTTREQTYEFMNATVPDEIKRDLHILLIRHGKLVCNARSPKCGDCILRDDCRYGQALKKEKERSDEEEEEEEDKGEKKVDKKAKGKRSSSRSNKKGAAKRKKVKKEDEAKRGRKASHTKKARSKARTTVDIEEAV